MKLIIDIEIMKIERKNNDFLSFFVDFLFFIVLFFNLPIAKIVFSGAPLTRMHSSTSQIHQITHKKQLFL